MEWKKPEIYKVELSSERPNILDRLHLAIDIEAAWADVGGLEQFIMDTAEKYGGTARIMILQEPQPPGEIETCAAFCRQPCTQRR